VSFSSVSYFKDKVIGTYERWYRLEWMLYKMVQFQKAQRVYEAMLAQTTAETEKENIYSQRGTVKENIKRQYG
jgi:hypothetical protein